MHQTSLKFTLFAEDSTLTYSFSRSDSQISQLILNTELSKINHWLLANNIKINIGKTNYMLFHYRQNVEIPEIRIGEEIVSRVESAKFLGVFLDQNLKI